MEDETLSCRICYEEKHIVGFSECNHPICCECCMKVCLLKTNATCPICRQSFKTVIFDKFPHKPFEKYNFQHLLNFGSSHLFANNEEILQKLKYITDYRCKSCGKFCENLETLIPHLEQLHDTYLCELCIKNLDFFPKDYTYFTKKDLILHLNDSVSGHPQCPICNHRFFHHDNLSAHQRKDHISCYLCPGNLFVLNIANLKTHARDCHFLCETGACSLFDTVTMFLTESELQDHRILYHFKDLNNLDFNFINNTSEGRTKKHLISPVSQPQSSVIFEQPRLDDLISFPSLINEIVNLKIKKIEPFKPKTKKDVYDREFPSLVQISQNQAPLILPSSNTIKPIPPIIPSIKPQIKNDYDYNFPSLFKENKQLVEPIAKGAKMVEPPRMETQSQKSGIQNITKNKIAPKNKVALLQLQPNSSDLKQETVVQNETRKKSSINDYEHEFPSLRNRRISVRSMNATQIPTPATNTPLVKKCWGSEHPLSTNKKLNVSVSFVQNKDADKSLPVKKGGVSTKTSSKNTPNTIIKHISQPVTPHNVSRKQGFNREFPPLRSSPFQLNEKKERKQLSPKTTTLSESTEITLIDRVKDLCNNDQLKFKEFMILSGKYHQNKITSTSYRKRGVNILGKQKMDDLLPYLIDSLDGELKENLIKTTKTKIFMSFDT
ncbi:hypothetical protein HZS_2979 [Henneguya salminicola]|nr:hypothetical protein HZS_2979 [Henneguya salminicola]